MLVIENTDGTSSSFEVRYFIYEGALSECYSLSLEVLDINDRLGDKDLKGRRASFTYLGSNAQNQMLNGVITQIQKQQDPVKLTIFYHIEIRPYLSLLNLARDLKVHNKESYLEIANQMISRLSQEYALSEYADFQISIPWLTAPLKTHDVQFEESNLAYFDKIMAFARYYFAQGEDSESLIVIDQPNLLPMREQNLMFDPSRKEDLKNNSPAFYELALQREAQNLSASPFYFDPKNPAHALKALQNGDAYHYEVPIYAPVDWYEFLKMKLTEQMRNQTQVYRFKGYYSDLNVGERLEVTSSLGNGGFEGFIESLRIEGHYQDDVWRFDVAGIIRPYDPNGIWLGAYQARKPLPAVIAGGILQDANQVNDFGEYQVKFPLGFNVDDTSPVISIREIQETATSEGGASHSVSGTSDTVLVTQNGLPSDLLITGSLIDNKRTSYISAESYREAGVQMKGGLKMHMRRSDGANAFSEMGTSLKDSQGNPAHLTLGANSQTLSEQGDRAHGLIQQSTGFAKRVASGNDYDTVGDPNNPVEQKSIVKQNGQTVHATQTNVASGSYNQMYYTQANGIKIDNAPVQAKPLQTNPNIKHYFYVVPQTMQLSDLADQLYGANTSSPAKELFTHINLQAYGNALIPGVWAYIPMATQTYKADDVVAVGNGLQQIQSQVDEQNKESLGTYGLWHQVFGWNYENTLVLTGTYLKINSTQINAHLAKVSENLNRIGQINQEA